MDNAVRYANASEVGSAEDGPALFGATMGLVAATAGLFAFGAYLGRDLSDGWGLLWFVAAFGSLIAMRFAVRQSSTPLAVGLLFLFGVLIGLGTAPTLAYYASTNPQVVWQAGAATALFMTALGAAGYGSRRDLAALARVSFWALVVLILFGVLIIFVDIPNGALIYAIAGLVIFAGLTVVDFQRLRRSSDTSSAPMMAVSIFLDALNVFLFFLTIFDRRS